MCLFQRPRWSRRPLGLVLASAVLSVLLAGCDRAGVPEAAPDCEARGEPCSWRDVDPEVMTRTGALLQEAGGRLEGGADPAVVAADLADDPDVIALSVEEGGILFRLEGGMPVVALTDAASPVTRALEEAPSADAARGVDALDADGVLAAGLWAPRLLAQGGAEATTFGTTQAPGERIRRALVLSPFHTSDREDFDIQRGAFPDAPLPERPLEMAASALGADPWFSVLHLKDEDATMTAFRSFARYDVVLVESHGWSFDCIDDPPQAESGFESLPPTCGKVMAGGPLPEGHPFQDGPRPARAQLRDLVDGVTIAWRYGEFRYAFLDTFFQRTYREGLPETLLLLNVCEFGTRGVVPVAGPVIAATRAIDGLSADLAFGRLVALMGREGVDLATGMRRLEADEDLASFTSDFVRLGQNVRARDAITIVSEGAELTPGTDVRAEGTPEDGEDDRIRRLTLRVDGVVDGTEEATELRLWIDGQEVDLDDQDVELSERTLVADGGEDADWARHDILLEDVQLPFDLARADVSGSRPHHIRAEVDGSDGRIGRHEVEGVYLRMGQVRVLDPATTIEYREGDEVEVEGRADDGRAEHLPIVVRLDYLSERDADGYVVRLQVHNDRVELPLAEFEKVEDGFYRYEDEVEVADVPEEGLEVELIATLLLDGEEVDEHLADPVVLNARTGEMGCLDVAVSMMGVWGVIFVNPDESGPGPPNFVDREGARDLAGSLRRWRQGAPAGVVDEYRRLEQQLGPAAREYAAGGTPTIDEGAARATLERIGDWYEANCPG